MKNHTSLIKSALIATIVAAIFVAAITVIAELVPPVKNWLKDVHYHHWVGKGIWTGIIFFVLTFGLYPLYVKSIEESLSKYVRIAGHFLVASSIVILVFYIYEYIIQH